MPFDGSGWKEEPPPQRRSYWYLWILLPVVLVGWFGIVLHAVHRASPERLPELLLAAAFVTSAYWIPPLFRALRKRRNPSPSP
jgi:hypothetical protein